MRKGGAGGRAKETLDHFEPNPLGIWKRAARPPLHRTPDLPACRAPRAGMTATPRGGSLWPPGRGTRTPKAPSAPAPRSHPAAPMDPADRPHAPAPPCAARAAPRALLLLLLAIAPACAQPVPRAHPEDVKALVRTRPVLSRGGFEPLSDAERAELEVEGAGVYRIGVGDLLHIQGLGQQFQGFGETPRGEIVGTKVKPDGQIYMPFLGAIPAQGRTVLEVQDALREALKTFNRDPDAYVSVDVLEFRSQKYFVLGEVTQPGIGPVDGEVTLLEALARAGGFSPDSDIDQAVVVRAQKVLPLSLSDLVRRGDLRQNIVLKDHDLIFVPSRRIQRVFVLGEVKKPGVFPLHPEDGITLIEAVTLAEGLRPETADVNQVRIFRGGWAQPESFTLSSEELYRHGASIHLFPGDRVFVAPTDMATYSRALQLAAPLVSLPLSVAGTAFAWRAVTD